MQLQRNEMYPQSELDNYKLQVDLLQQKLKQSEENRQQLQKELQQIFQRRSEHDKSVRSKIRQKYQSFLDEQERRNERNKMLMQMLERIDQQSAALTARSERLKMMKLQYERYFAKLMQTQTTVSCIQQTGLTNEVTPIAAMHTTTQIPVLLPAVETQQPAAAAVGTQNKNPATPSMPATNPIEEVKVNEPGAAVLTPRMWTFAMATPTPAGLLLTGTPTATLGATALPATTIQYPLGCGTFVQQPFQGQPQQQYQNPELMRFRNRFGGDKEIHGKRYNGANSYGVWDDDFPVDTRDASTSTSKGNVNKDGGDGKESEHEPSTYATTAQQTDIKATDTLPGPQLDLEIKISDQTVVNGAIADSRNYNKILSGVSNVHLEDTFDDSKAFSVSSDSFEGATSPSRASANYGDTNFRPRSFMKPENTWEKRGPTGLQSAEEHKRKIAEIERKFGTSDIADSSVNQRREKDNDDRGGYSSFKRFSEMVNSTANSNDEELTKSFESKDKQRNEPWQMRTSPRDYAPKSTFSSTAAPPKAVSIDNIESAIYGELVTPHLTEDNKAPTIRTAAQGFFTELLGQPETEVLDGGIKETSAADTELVEADSVGTAAESAVKQDDTPNLGYANYSTSIEGSESADMKVDEIANNTAVEETLAPQQQATYDTANTEFYPQTSASENVYGTSELTNAYAEYATDQTIEQPITEDNSAANQQLQSAPEDYAQQSYENYDATQYENYDPNAYPGYIYDETTGQYVVDPQYVAPEGETQEAAYAAQGYSEQLSQEQMGYQESADVGQVGQGVETNYTYEDGAYPQPVAASVAELNETTATAAVEEVAQSATPVTTPSTAAQPAAPPVTESAPKVLKPTSILATAVKQSTQSEAQKKKKRVIFVDSSETDDSSSVKAAGAAATPANLGVAAGGGESDFDFSSGAETSVG